MKAGNRRVQKINHINNPLKIQPSDQMITTTITQQQEEEKKK